ncbi:FAD-dependent oxidoreductase [Aspergillus tanneri]|uniref:FAD-binding domain-containing protein n=1 Tax=Aspergillus tanneri TaxID=1220188 RepID=A0A5M9MVG9_9EURO|nr:uncharacterized protein ATNIH1004_005231 [Aspergillus tanneri]KAA8649330.1 hypothetical protein ATNIH1004_005231 [Aspergillus tanneri]
MDSLHHPFKVLIVGGGICGLSLALMLQEAGIDFQLFEAYPEVTPAVGAGIALLPNGNRILDQLGCYEEMLRNAGHAINAVCIRGPDGGPLWTFEKADQRSIERHGYPMFFCDRQRVLDVLYSRLRDLSKVLTKKRVVRIEQTEDEAHIIVKDGSVYTGDVVIGADGVNSVVRHELRRHAVEKGLGSDYDDDNAMPANYACMFGISTGVPRLAVGPMHFVCNEGFSYVIGTGSNRQYWFLIENLGKTYRGQDIPKFGSDDLEQMVRKHWNDRLTTEVCFGELYESRNTIVYTPLREGVLKNWHFGRVLTIGDASHKLLPLLAQGGNSAIESAACLTNCLFEVLKCSRSDRLPLEQITAAFRKLQNIRIPRVTALAKLASGQQRLDAMITPEIKALVMERVPKLVPENFYEKWHGIYDSAVSLSMLPMPARPRKSLYYDEISHPGVDLGRPKL